MYRTGRLVANEDRSIPVMQNKAPITVTMRQPKRSHNDVVSGPKKNIIPVASDPTQAVRKKLAYINVCCLLNFLLLMFFVVIVILYPDLPRPRVRSGYEIIISVNVMHCYQHHHRDELTLESLSTRRSCYHGGQPELNCQQRSHI